MSKNLKIVTILFCDTTTSPLFFDITKSFLEQNDRSRNIHKHARFHSYSGGGGGGGGGAYRRHQVVQTRQSLRCSHKWYTDLNLSQHISLRYCCEGECYADMRNNAGSPAHSLPEYWREKLIREIRSSDSPESLVLAYLTLKSPFDFGT